MVNAAQERMTTARELLARTEARLRARAVTVLDLALAERELGQAESDLAAARREREEASGQFRSILDLPPLAEISVAPIASPEMPRGVRREDAATRAVAYRREQASVAAASARTRVSVSRLRAQAVAPVLVNGEFEWQAYQQGSFGMSAQWALPVLHTAQGERAVATAEALGLDRRRALTEREVATAWSVLAARLDEVQALLDRVIPAAARTVTLTEALFESGAAEAFRVLLARQDFAAARIRLLNTLREAWIARIALDRAVGGA
jgi:outer membrane protein TolC